MVAEQTTLDGATIVKMIEDPVDARADVKVDVLVQCVFARFSTGIPSRRDMATDTEALSQTRYRICLRQG